MTEKKWLKAKFKKLDEIAEDLFMYTYKKQGRTEFSDNLTTIVANLDNITQDLKDLVNTMKETKN